MRATPPSPSADVPQKRLVDLKVPMALRVTFTRYDDSGSISTVHLPVGRTTLVAKTAGLSASVWELPIIGGAIATLFHSRGRGL